MDTLNKTLQFKKNVLLKDYSTFGIGGPALFLAEVFSAQQLKEAIEFANASQLKFIVIGKGSNCLFDDRGFAGLVIINKISYRKQQENRFEVGSGYSFALLGVQTAKAGYAGLEFASGIPATVGGAIYMNAGAGKSETKDCLESVTIMNHQGDIQVVQKKEIEFGYRYSSFQKQDSIILSAVFSLIKDKLAKENQTTLLNYRLKTQPYEHLSIGCCFKNPPSASAGALIDGLNLKGLQVGGAKISEKHANFIINAENAKASDVLSLMGMIEEQIENKCGIKLHREIKVIPYDI
jgi:UDP-N-acetylmuramate dehydrogenase